MYPYLMQRYLTEQLQQLQLIQQQQNQFILCQYQQIRAWQNFVFQFIFANQLFWLPKNGSVAITFAPFSMPFAQYSLQLNRYHESNDAAPHPIRDVTDSNAQNPTVQPDSQPQISLREKENSVNVAETHEKKESEKPVNKAAQSHVATTQEKPLQDQDIIAKATTPTSTQSSTKQATNQPAKSTSQKSATDNLADAKQAILKLQAEHSDLPAGVNVTAELANPTLNSEALPTAQPVSAIEQARHPVAIIDLNTATEAELVRLDGVNSRRAQDIIEYRQSVGRFATIDELVNVKGIGQSTVDKNRTIMKVTNDPTDDVATDKEIEALINKAKNPFKNH